MNIKYDIAGVTETKYEEVKDDCAYGLYKEPAKEPENQNVLTTDGSTDVVIYYTGEKPATIIITPVTNTGTSKDAMSLASTTTSVFDVTDETVKIKASWLASVKTNAKFGTGTYKITFNGADYTMTVQ